MKDTTTVKVLPTETYFALVRQTLSQNKRAFIQVTGMSMWPLLYHIRDGVEIIPPEHLKAGDIVLYDRRNGRYALHRIIHKGKDSFTMAGDHQWHMEKGLSYDQIVGVVDMIYRDGKKISADDWLIKMYSGFVIMLAYPRIYGYQFLRKCMKVLHRGGKIRKEQSHEN